ncbi:MAG: c-type cytochrome biogenesis protein CcmI [Proteobacteria bacterium]|nr:c-type cytochrome biogenesis protein CcmI [Pseudomonadota bacterium]
MIFWVIAGGLCALAVGLLVLPLLRRPGESAPRAAYDLNVYKDQLAEIARETARGELGAAQADAARAEIERRLLAAAEAAAERGSDQATPRRAISWGVALALAIAVPAAAIGLYLTLGTPGVPSVPFAERPAPQPPAPEPGFAQEMADLAARLAKRLDQDPRDRDGWLLLGRTYAQLQHFDKAAEAYRTAIAHGFDGAETQSALGEVLVAGAGGAVGPEARRAFAASLENDSEDPRARYYAGLALAQDDRLRAAIDLWLDLLRESTADAPWRPMVAQQIREAAARLGIEPPEAAAAPAPESAPQLAPPGPSAADVEAAREMSPDQQAAFIRSMVERLAERLETEPGDFQGWLRLARAYGVLGEAAQAETALTRAAALVRDLPEDAPERAQFDEAGRALLDEALRALLPSP